MVDTGGPFDAETVLQHLQEPVFVVHEGELAFANERFFEVYGWSRDAIPGTDYRELDRVVEDGFAEFREAIETMAGGDVSEKRVELTMSHPESAPVPRRLPVTARLTPIADAGTEGVLVSLRDVTQRKAQEERLREQRERMESLVDVVSHDLRNPLSVARGNLELAREECDSEHLGTVADAHERMAELIDDLLTSAAKGEAGVDREPTDLAGVAEEGWRNVATAEATLQVDVGRTVSANRSRLQQLFENLFRNSVEHAGEAVTVRVGAIDDDGFYVADDGSGIPVERREEVFETGFSTDGDGSGYGLTIVEEIAAAHGWDVAAAESEDGGARFEVTGVEFVE